MIAPYLKLPEWKIKAASEPENATLLYDFVSQQLNYAKYGQCCEFKCLESLFRVLLDTALDEVLPYHWRAQCLDYICMPLEQMQRIRLSSQAKKRVARLYYELKVVGDYSFLSIINPTYEN